MPIESTDPYTGIRWATYEPYAAEEVERRVARAERTYLAYRTSSFSDRRAWLLRAAELFEQRADTLGLLATREMGKPLASAVAEVRKCAYGLRYYAHNAERFLVDEEADATAVGAREARVAWYPIGPVLAVMPWNYPYWQAIRFAAPALMAGNVVLLKHASNVPACALAIEEIFIEAGCPEGTFQTLLVGSAAVEALVNDDRIAAVTLTGSEAAGRAVGRAAGGAIKKVVLELGGSDPFIVMPSADLEEAARVAVASRFQNAGQSCIAAKRFIVHTEAAAFVEAFVENARSLIMGNPRDEATQLGPVATKASLAELEDLVEDAVGHGAKIRCGGSLVPGDGWFFEPTVLTDISDAMRLYREEAFGPVASVIEVSSVEEAISVANATRFGLSANVWTTDDAEVLTFVNELEAGAVFVNGMTASYPELPFGGIKNSGYGRELSYFGIREFCNAKTIWKG